MQDSQLKARCLEFLYTQVSKGNIPNGIRKGMVEELVGFIEGLRAEEQAQQMAKRMQLEAAILEKEAGNE
jgi:hypothetical protein